MHWNKINCAKLVNIIPVSMKWLGQQGAHFDNVVLILFQKFSICTKNETTEFTFQGGNADVFNLWSKISYAQVIYHIPYFHILLIEVHKIAKYLVQIQKISTYS